MNRLLKLLHLKKSSKKSSDASSSLPKCLIHMPSMMMMDILTIDTNTYVSLADMPEVIVNKVLKNLDFRSVQILRKTCRGFRNHIDHVKPEANAKRFQIEFESEMINVVYGNYRTKYHKHNSKDCLEEYGQKSMVFENSHYVDIFLRDFFLISQNQNSLMDSLIVSLNGKEQSEVSRLLEGIEKILKSRKHLLKVTGIILVVSGQTQILSMLPYLEPDSLRAIIIGNPSFLTGMISGHQQRLEMNEVVKLEQWKKAEEISIAHFKVNVPIDHFSHFTTVNTGIDNIAMKELINIKNIFLKSSSHRSFCISYSTFFGNAQFFELLGVPLLAEAARILYKMWYFEIPGSEQVLEISHLEAVSKIIFTRIEFPNVPAEAIIQT